MMAARCRAIGGGVIFRWMAVAAAAMVMSFSAGPAARADEAFEDCNGAAFVAAVNDVVEMPNFECEELERRTLTVNGQVVNVRVIKDKKTNPQLVQQQAAEVLSVAEQAYAVFGGLDQSLRFKNVSFIVMDPMIQWPSNTMGAATDTPTGECTVRMFASNSDNSPYSGGMQLFQLTVAHELFHCVQFATYPKQLTMQSSIWWFESGAELASHLVFPTPGRMEAIAKGFAKFTRVKPLTQMAYEDLVLMSWLYARDPARVFAVMSAMPTEEDGEAAQQKRLLTQVSAEELQVFAQDWVDGKIPMPGGAGMFAAPELPQAMQIETDTEMTMDGPVFAIQLDAASISKGMFMPLEFDGGTVSVFQRKKAEADWDVLPGEVGPEDCKGNDDRLLVRMPTEESAAKVRIQFKKTKPCEECINSDVRDQCLVGHWKMDTATLLTFLRTKDDGDSHFEWVDGTLVLVYDANGESHLVAEGLEIKGTQKADPYPESSMTMEMNGIDAGTWSAEGGQVTYCPKESGIDYKTTIEVPGVTKAERTVDGVMQTSVFSYQCGADGLDMTYTGPLELGAEAPRWHFTKVK